MGGEWSSIGRHCCLWVGGHCLWMGVGVCGGVLLFTDGGWSFIGGCHHKWVVIHGHLCAWGGCPCVGHGCL